MEETAKIKNPISGAINLFRWAAFSIS